MMISIEHANLDARTLKRAQCELDYACLTDGDVCRTEPFIDRDVQLLRCLDARNCRHQTHHGNMVMCSCPVKRALTC